MKECYLCGSDIVESGPLFNAFVRVNDWAGFDIVTCGWHDDPCGDIGRCLWNSVGGWDFGVGEFNEKKEKMGNMLKAIKQDPDILYSI